MKPRITLAETAMPDGAMLALQEHDGRKSLSIHGQQICGPSTRAAEEEVTRLACAPFRPARQPKLWFAGLGLGQALAAATATLPQHKGTFIVAEPEPAIPRWHREFLTDSPLLTDKRVILKDDCSPRGLAEYAGLLHAIIIHLDASPMGPRNRPWTDDRKWLSAAYEALQPGGLLAIASSRPVSGLSRRLHAAGFDVAEHQVPASPDARKPRLLPIWLARKGKAAN